MAVIVPVTTTRTVACLEKDGKVFCERPDVSGAEVGLVIMGMVLWASLLLFLIYIYFEVLDWAAGGAIALVCAYIFLTGLTIYALN